MPRYDVCVVGHITDDTITTADGHCRKAIGGAAYYAGVALGHLGLRTLVLTTAAKRDLPRFRDALGEHGVDVQVKESPHTTAFENDYAARKGRRIQRLGAVARPFALSDLRDIDAGCFHLGPLTAAEITPECFRELGCRSGKISLDLQGFTRSVTDGAVRTADWPDKADILKFVDILKANRWEARAVAGIEDPVAAARRLARMGPGEVIVTLAGKGAILCVGNDVQAIPAMPVAAPRDPTGCGDSFCAGYLFARLRGRTAPEAARFAAALAAAKLMRDGPFTGSASDVEALLR